MLTIVSKTNTYLKAKPALNRDVARKDRVQIYQRRAYKCTILDKQNKYTHVDLGSLGQWWIDTADWQGLDQGPLAIDKPLIETKVGKLHLKLPYFKQKDIQQGGYRTSLYLCCAAAAMYLKPGRIVSPEEYYRKVQLFGGHECPYANVDFLKSIGIKSCYRKDGTIQDLKRAIDFSVPAICCVLNQGRAGASSGEGHWINVVGCDENFLKIIVNDPLGNLIHATGNYEGTNGEGLQYSKNYFQSRWSVEGYATGWWISFAEW